MNRTPASDLEYTLHVNKVSKLLGYCVFHDDKDRKKLETFKHWFLTPNDFPYKWTEEHYLLIPKRHTNKLNEEEEQELDIIAKDYDNENYLIYKNVPSICSVWCVHYHVIKPR